MARYRAKVQLLIGSQPVKAGEEFASEMPPGRNWQPLDDAARAAVAARFGSTAVDVDRPHDYWHANFSAVR